MALQSHRRALRNEQKKTAERERRNKAAGVNGDNEFPMPLTKKEAAETEIVPKDTFATKNCVISKAMAIAERDDKRFTRGISRPTRVLLECRQLAMEPDREPDLEPGADGDAQCAYKVDAAYSTDLGDLVTNNDYTIIAHTLYHIWYLTIPNLICLG